MSTGFPIDEMAAQLSRLKNISIDDAFRFLSGKETSAAIRSGILNAAGGPGAGATAGHLGKAATRFAASPFAKHALRAVPILSTGLAALDAADIVTNDTNIGNKLMDTAAMGIGGVLGGIAGGPLGATAGASTGKWASDSLQWLFGDKKTPEQRKMEEALAILGAR